MIFCVHTRILIIKNIARYGKKITRNTVGERITCFDNFIEHLLLARCPGVQIQENTLNFTFNSFVDFIHVL
jgi:hypothetical protein